MSSREIELKKEFQQNLPRREFLGTDNQYQSLLNQYVLMDGDTKPFLLDSVVYSSRRLEGIAT